MKISGVGTGSTVSGGKRTEKAEKKGEFKRALIDAMDTMEDAHAVETPSAIGGVDALLVVQSVGDSLEHEARQRLIQRGEDILDKLEEVRHGLLMGEIPKEKLTALAQMVRNRREACADPRLAAILDEIELRAEVELAKLSRGA
ncbi:MAG: flagellar assembly protein FliX [Actinomycetota bacterium]